MTIAASDLHSVGDALNYSPVPLRFGTSGRRGLVADLTQLEIWINVKAELEYLLTLSREKGGIVRGEEFYLAADLRPSSTSFVPEQGNRGEIAQAALDAIEAAGMKLVYLGQIPTPALANFALQSGKGSIMVTGSHIPFDRNGYKTNSARAELRKEDEAAIEQRVNAIREAICAQPLAHSIFNENGMLKAGHRPLPAGDTTAAAKYLSRYEEFFRGYSLKGKRILVYQHSAVGRDLLVELLRRFGAEAIPIGRSESFVPIDTENIGAAELGQMQSFVSEVQASQGPVDAVVSTDGDSDRPLVVGVNKGRVQFYSGDLVGMVVAEYLGADAVVVPVSCNDAVERGKLREVLEPKTRIGSPFVIIGMEKALAKGRQAVCGWEANGGFLTGSCFKRAGKSLPPLPTRDAFLPILAVLLSAAEKRLSLGQLFGLLPGRFTQAALLKNFPRADSRRILGWISPTDASVTELSTETGGDAARLIERLERFFSPELGFTAIQRINYTDGARIYFANGDIAHIRPSGNADELRIYAVADMAQRAKDIAAMATAEPDGILRRLDRATDKLNHHQ